MKAPSCSSAINRTWVQFVLEEYLKKHNPQPIPQVKVEDFVINRGAKAGDAFNSELVTLDISTSQSNGDDSDISSTTKKDYHFMVKFLSTDVFNREMNKKFQSSLKEYTIYAEYIKQLNDFQLKHTNNDEFRIYIPELIYGKHSDKEFVLVMENISFDDYGNNDKYKGLDLVQLKEAVTQLARIHALSYIHNKTHPFLEKYPSFKISDEILEILVLFFGVTVDHALALLRSKEGTSDLVDKFEKNKDIFKRSLLSVMKDHPSNIPMCLVHGDYWNNNIMYKNERNKVKCKVVDWGNSGWASPVMDLQYLMYTSTTLETRKEHLETLLQQYHSEFVEITTKLSQDTPKWTYSDFLHEWKRLSHYGLIMGLALSQGTLSKSNPLSKQQSASLLDQSFCFPTKIIVDGMKQMLARAAIGFMNKPSGKKMMASLNRKMFSPIKEELLSGSNEVMNKRVLDLLYEADERGLFEKG